MDDDEVQLVLNSDSVTFTLWHNNSKVSVPCYIKLQHKEVIAALSFLNHCGIGHKKETASDLKPIDFSHY